jgi:hypothetical protein
MQISREVQIADMLAEIELDLHARKVTDDSDTQYGCYFAAKVELECGQPPNMAYVHNLLAHALNRPLATRH